MQEIMKIEINQFTLIYDGMYKVQFEYVNKVHKFEIYLSPTALIQLIRNEGLESNTIQQIEGFEGLQFSKSTLLFKAIIEESGDLSFLTHVDAELYQDYGFYLIRCDLKSE